MRKYIAIIILCLIGIITSCDKNLKVIHTVYNSDSIQHIDLNPCLDYESYNVSDIVDSISLTFLETNDNSLLGSVIKTIITDDRIYIQDNYNRSGVAIFDRQGNFMTRLKKGNGPGEIPVVLSILYDRYNKELLVLCPKTLMVFDENGCFLDNKYIDFPCSKLVGCTEKSYIYSKVFDMYSDESDFSNYSLIVSDKSMNLSHLLLPYSKAARNMITPNSGFELNNDIVVREPYTDSIYIFRDDSLYLYKTFDFSSNKLDLSQFSSIDDFMEKMMNSDKYSGAMYSGDYFENSSHIIFGLEYGDLQYPIFINKLNNHSFFGQMCNIEPDKHITICVPKGVYKDWFYEIKYPNTDLYKSITSNQYVSVQDLSMLKKLTDNSNPFIMFYKLRNF